MFKKFYCFVSFTFVFCMLGSASAELVAYYPMNEGSGSVVADASGNGYDGTTDGSPTWVDGPEGFGTALSFAEATSGVDCGTFEPAADGIVSIAAWAYFELGGGKYQGFICKNGSGKEFMTEVGGTDGNIYWNSDGTDDWGLLTLTPGEWVHVALVHDNANATTDVYLNGVYQKTSNATWAGDTPDATIYVGATATYNFFNGMMDEVYFFNHLLTAEEVVAVMNGELGQASTAATKPYPANDANDISRDVVLNWKPGTADGKSAVYFGDNFEDVNDGTALANPGQDANSYDPGRLEFGTTYFWRVDDINTVDSTVTAGAVWSFTVEPYSIEIPGDEITVSASTSKAGNPPSRLVDGSGLTQMSHSTAISDMWVSSPTDTDPWLLFEFDRTKELDKMLLWNSNSEIEDIIGMGVKDVNILTSIDGENWTALSSVQVLQAPIPITADYNTPQEIDLGLAVAKYVKINILSNWGGASTSVSEVKFFTIPLEARQPLPGDGALDVAPDSTLQWRAGREADDHRFYFSADMNAVADGSVSPMTPPTSSITLSSLDISLGETYYWRVDEVNNGENPSLWTGLVWSFTTPDYLVVDDFESYGNVSPDLPFQSWLDGLGYTADEYFPEAYPGNGTGSIVGHDIWSVGAVYTTTMETGIVYGGSQSMPLYYDGAGSQTDLTLDHEDWTQYGITTLVVHFYGMAGNTGQLYVKIGNTKIPYTGDANDIAAEGWTTWVIDLASSGASLANVSTLSIGIDGSDAGGLLYIDDIRLYAVAPRMPERIQIEAESGTLPAPWVILDDAEASGSRYIDTAEGTESSLDAPLETGIATYDFTVDGGVYKIKLRVSGITGGDDDSLWIRIPDVSDVWVKANQLSAQYDANTGGWQQIEAVNDGGDLSFTLPAGSHTLEIGHREVGVAIDLITIESIGE